jgi:hypothetical protein
MGSGSGGRVGASRLAVTSLGLLWVRKKPTSTASMIAPGGASRLTVRLATPGWAPSTASTRVTPLV